MFYLFSGNIGSITNAILYCFLHKIYHMRNWSNKWIRQHLGQNAFSLTLHWSVRVNVSDFPFIESADTAHIMTTAIVDSSMCQWCTNWECYWFVTNGNMIYDVILVQLPECSIISMCYFNPWGMISVGLVKLIGLVYHLQTRQVWWDMTSLKVVQWCPRVFCCYTQGGKVNLISAGTVELNYLIIGLVIVSVSNKLVFHFS